MKINSVQYILGCCASYNVKTIFVLLVIMDPCERERKRERGKKQQ